MSQSLYLAVTVKILTALSQGVVPWRKPWHEVAALPVNALSRRPYRGVNVILLGLGPHRDHRWLTFRQAQQLGGSVKRGEQATVAIFWKCLEVDRTDPDSGEAQPARIPLLRRNPVFNVEQCEALKLPALEATGPARVAQRIERAETLRRSMPSPPTIQEQGTAAWYRPTDDVIQVPPLSAFDGADPFYATLFHELGHATGHVTRLNRAGVTGQTYFGSLDYSREELVAELTSAFCCALTGLDNSLLDNAASYIQGWLQTLRNDPKAVVIAAAQAQHAADYIRGLNNEAWPEP